MSLCKSILVVEDNDDVREAIVDALTMEGFQVKCAPDGKIALEILGQMKEPTLVLLDLMMPVMNGWEFLDAQKKDSRLSAHRVVTISSVAPSQSVEDPAPLKIDGAIRKPLALESIWEQVHRYVETPAPAPSAR